MPAGWSLFSAGTFEQDADLTGQALQLPTPPRHVCAVAAGVREFGRVVENPDGVFGVAQTTHQTVLVRWANGEPVPARPLP